MRNYAVVQQILEVDLGASQVEFITSDMSVSDVRKLMLRRSLFKKLSPSGKPTAEQIAIAIDKFKRVNNSLPEVFTWVSENEAESCFYDYFCDHVNQALRTSFVDSGFGYPELLLHMTSGPGASQLADNDSWHTKVFESKLSYTSEALIPIYRTALSESGAWAEAEMQRSSSFGFKKVQGGKLFFVLKNVGEARTCCTEPGLNSIVQQGVRGMLEDCLVSYFGINVKTQPAVNRRLAWQGLLDGSFGTVDLTSASDSNGLSLFKTIVRPCFLKRLILESRCEVAVLPGGDIESLRMVSTMGNAFTFPLMTILLASATRACLDLLDPGAEFSVFGDDIVVPIRAYSFLIKMLRKLGYIPNDDKSFGVGPFRESCGHDYYNGHFVRGVYVKSLEAPALVYSAFNRLARWSAANEIPLPGLLKHLRSMVRDIRVPPSEDDLSGIKVPFKLTKPRLTSTYWFKYRCLKRVSRFLEVVEKDSDGEYIEMSTSHLVSALAGVHSHTWVRSTITGESSSGRLGSFIRDPVGAPPRMKITSRSIPYWNYDKPASEPGESWLPGQTSKYLTRYDFDPLCLRLSEAPHLWDEVLVGAFSV